MPKLGENVLHGVGERAFDRAATRAFMAAPAKLLGYMGDIKFALAAQAHPIAAFGQLAKECRNFDPANGKHVVDQTFAIFFFGFAALHLLECHPCVTDVAFDIEIAQRLA